MKNLIHYISIVYLLILLGCQRHEIITTPPEPRPEGWVALGLEGKTINRLVISGEWLYACAGKDGLFRTKHSASTEAQWQYLGLGDLRVEQPGTFGVTDVVTRNDTIVASFWTGTDRFPNAGIYRSIDDGKSWMPSDSGFVEDQNSPTSSVALRLAQSPHDPRMLLAGCIIGPKVYLSKDFGLFWEPLFSYTHPGIYASFYTLSFHPRIPNELWAGGQSGSMTPRSLLFRSTDFGQTWQSITSLPRDLDQNDSVNDIAFDPKDDGTIYVCLDRIIVKTADSGQNWFTSLDTVKAAVLWNVNIDPFDSKTLIACATDSLYKTTDGGNKWNTLILAPENSGFMAYLAVDWIMRILYVSTYNPSKGVYKLYF